jgi:Tol biopolymer transport system component
MFAGTALASIAALLVLAVSPAAGAPPTVTINPATEVHYTTAKAGGEIEPSGTETFYHFEVATEADFSNAESQGFGEIPGSAGPTSVEAELSGLHPATTYHLRLHVENNLGEVSTEALAPPFTTEAVATPVVSIEAVSGPTPTTAHLVGHIDPEANQPEGSTSPAEGAAFEVHWHFHCDPECPGLEGALAADDTGHEVSALATGLLPGTVYEAGLIAENAGGEATRASAGPTTFSTPAAPPLTASSSATETNGTEATLTAEINPRGAPTTYHFEYLTDAQFQGEGGFAGPDTVSTPESSSIGEDDEAHPVSAQVGGLQPGATYHFRVAATNTSPGDPTVFSAERTFIAYAGAGGTPEGECPNEALRSGLSVLLPECRAYEQVTPPFKSLQLVGALPTSQAGTLFGFSVGTFAGGGTTATINVPYEFSREQSGWVTTPLSPPPGFLFGPATQGFSTLFNGAGATNLISMRPASAPAYRDDLYLERKGTFTEVGPLIAPAAIPPTPVGYFELFHYTDHVDGVSRNLSHVIFGIQSVFGTELPPGVSAESNLWPGDETVSRNSLYEYTGTGNARPQLVGVDEAGALISQCGTYLGGTTGEANENEHNSVSADGEVVFFTVNPGGCTNSLGQTGSGPPARELFARLSGSRTVAISEPSSADCRICDTAEPANAEFLGASEDGKRVYFLTEQELLPGTIGPNIYEYDFEAPPATAGDPAGRISLVSAGAADPEVQGVGTISEDGSSVYFVAHADLGTGPEPGGASPTPGGENLYDYHQPGPGLPPRVSFVASLSPEDAAQWSAGAETPMQATGDGRYLVFTSVADLTPDDTSTANQVFRYDDSTGSLVRVSIGDLGFNDDGNTTLGGTAVPRPNFQASGINARHPAISEDGSTVVFQSPVGLTPRALNGLPAQPPLGRPLNVYAYRDGRVHLISDGRVSLRVTAIGIDPSGTDIFFRTANALVPQDRDTSSDVYDARLGGGFAAPTEPSACGGESCQGSLVSAPPVAPPGSATFTGAANPRPHRRHKRHHRKHHHHRRHRAHHHRSHGRGSR